MKTIVAIGVGIAAILIIIGAILIEFWPIWYCHVPIWTVFIKGGGIWYLIFNGGCHH